MSAVVYKMNLATPIAHETTANHFQAYYSGAKSVFQVTAFFNRSGCKGIRLKKNAAVTTSTAAQFDLYALSDGFLTFADNSLKFRLATELTKGNLKQYCSGSLQGKIGSKGPQLRHLVYKFLAGTDRFDIAIKPKISALLGVALHPLRTMVTVKDGAKVVNLGAYLDSDPANAATWIAGFKAGSHSLFVKAGDVIGNFFSEEIELQFVDSCGAKTASSLDLVMGRATNPSHFLYKFFKDAAHSNQLTKIDRQADAKTDAAHPLMNLYRPVTSVPATANADQFLDFSAPRAPKAALVTIACKNDAGTVLADAAIGHGTLGEWHKSRNAASSTNANAPVHWRLYGNDSADTDKGRYGMLVTELTLPSTTARLPGGTAFDHKLTPPNTADGKRVTRIWNLYHPIFNTVAQTFQIPCEILATIACSETGVRFDNNEDADVIRMEPLEVSVTVTAGTTLAKYKQLAHQNKIVNNKKVYGSGANAIMPRPWNGAALVGTGGPTWNELRDLVKNDSNVRVSPGCTQVLVSTAKEILTWARDVFGTGFLTGLSISVTNDAGTATTLTAVDPPTGLDAIFEKWFGIAVNASGVITTNAAQVDNRLTRFQRALHDVIATAALIKCNYNYATSKSNKMTDFDPPTLFSGYNDGAGRVGTMAEAGDSDDLKWQKLYGVVTYDSNYPHNGSLSYNRIVRYFNDQGYLTANPVAARPVLRLWPDS